MSGEGTDGGGPFLDTPTGWLYAVITGHGYCSIQTIHTDAATADETARAQRSCIVALPIVADYRTASPTAQEH